MTDQPTGEQAALARVERLALTFEVAGNEFIAERIRAAVTGVEPVPVVPVSSPPPNQTALRDRIAEAIGDFMGAICSSDYELAAAMLAVLPPPADRAAVLQRAADHFDARATAIADASDDPAIFVAKDRQKVAGVWRDGAAELRRLAAEARQPEACRNCRGSGLDPRYNGEFACPDCCAENTEAREVLAKDDAAEAQQPDTETPCGPTPDACDAEAGEPCASHEREQAHAEGEHCFCGPECSETGPVHQGGNADDCPACIGGGLDTIGPPYECPGPERP